MEANNLNSGTTEEIQLNELAGVSPEERQGIYCDDDGCLLYTSPSPRDLSTSRMPSSA